MLGLAGIMFVILGLVKYIRDRRASQRRPRLIGEEVSQVDCNDYGSIAHTRCEEKSWDDVFHNAWELFGER